MSLPIIYQVDAFTSEIFRGNPAGVCVLTKPADEKWMQHVAREMNVSETAFLYPVDEHWKIRFFTPTAEIDLCGHATLSSAHILWETGTCNLKDEIKLLANKDSLVASKSSDWINLDFPIKPMEEIAVDPEIEKALGSRVISMAKNSVGILAEVENEDIVRNISPDLNVIKHVDHGLIVTAKSNGKPYDFVSRFFAPFIGLNEDPVTGVTHCCLAPYWEKRLNKKQFTAYQSSARGGVVKISIKDNYRVQLSGQAVTALRCELTAL